MTIVYLAAGAIFAIIMLLARGERAHVFKRVSPGLLSLMGTVFGLLVVFSIFQVWGDFDRARMAVAFASQAGLIIRSTLEVIRF